MSEIRDIWVYANNINRSFRQLVNERLKPLQLTSAEGNILLHLLTQGDAICQEDLVAELDITKTAVSRALVFLQQKGHVTRAKDANDKRIRRIFLTERAKEIGPQIEKNYNEVLSLAAANLTEEEIKSSIQVFKQVSESFSQLERQKREGRDLLDAME